MQFSIKNNTYIYLTILLLLVPLPWLTAWLAAVCIHELGHFAAVWICGGRVEELTISIDGFLIRSSPMGDVKRVICTLCGPLIGLLPIVIRSNFPRVAICAWILTAYNLLPILPLDGGHILQILMADNRWFWRIQALFMAAIVILSIYAFALLKIGPFPLIVTGILLLKRRKTPCKKGFCRVQ